MGRAARANAAKKERSAVVGAIGPQIRLDNPVRDQFAKFIFANALQWEAMMHDELIRVAYDEALKLEPFNGILGFVTRAGRLVSEHSSDYARWLDFREMIQTHCTEHFVAEENSAAGQHIVICGAGPSLEEHMHEWCPQGDQVWGVNSALPFLVKHGVKVTHGVTVDQTPAMCEEWFSAPDVDYYLATTCHPHLTEYLLKKQRLVRFFNNFVGIREKPVRARNDDGTVSAMAYEDWLYSLLFHGTVRAGSGLNSATRAIDLALYVGAAKITVLGADCCIRNLKIPKGVEQGSPEHLQLLHGSRFHADGGHALASGATPMTFGGEIDGRHWETKPDLAISAVWLNKMREKLEGRLQLIGDTLPNALANAKTFRRSENGVAYGEPLPMSSAEEFLARMPTLVDMNGQPVPIAED